MSTPKLVADRAAALRDTDPAVHALVTKAHRKLAVQAEGLRKEPWLRALAALFTAGARTPKARARIVQITRIVIDDRDKRAELDTIARLTGSAAAVLAWVLKQTEPPPLTPEEREARRLAGIKRKAERAEKHARKMLTKHEKALKREKAAVQRWRVKVRYYDRKQGAE